MSESDKAMRNVEDPEGGGGRTPGRLNEPADDEAPVRWIVVDKKTPRVRLEN